MIVRNRLLILACVAIGYVGTSVASAAAEESGPAKPVTVLVAYDSLRGNTEQMAQAVADEAGKVPGLAVKLKKAEAVTKEDLQEARGIVLGVRPTSPTFRAA